jgi:hypothetical protein
VGERCPVKMVTLQGLPHLFHVFGSLWSIRVHSGPSAAKIRPCLAVFVQVRGLALGLTPTPLVEGSSPAAPLINVLLW